MTLLTTTGFQRDVTGYWIDKDPQAQLIYSLDWTDWLQNGDTIQSVQYTVTPTGSADDIHIVASGITGGLYTFVELSKGVVNEIYTVAAKVTTANDLTDVRRFRIKVKDRYL